MKRHVLFCCACAFHHARAFLLTALLAFSLAPGFAQDTNTYGQDATDTIPVPLTVTLSVLPNPFTDHARCSYTLPFDGQVRLELISYNGESLRVMTDEFLEAGKYESEVPTAGLKPGVYIVTLRLRSLFDIDRKSVRVIKML